MNLVVAVMLCATGTIYDDIFERGNTAYSEGRLEEAITSYRQLLDSGVKSAPVYYNLGNAYFHAGNTGRAVLSFECALASVAGYPPAVRGLEAVEASTGRTLGLPPGYRSPWRRPDAWQRRLVAQVALVFWWLFWGILLRAMWRPLPRARFLASVFLTLAVMFMALTGVLARLPGAGVVVDDVPLRFGPDLRDVERTLLHAGDRISLGRREGAWVLVETASGLRGWMSHADVAEVAAPFQDEPMREQLTR